MCEFRDNMKITKIIILNVKYPSCYYKQQLKTRT